MNEIIKSEIDRDVFKQLPSNYQYFVNLRASTPVNLMSERHQKNICLDVITKAMYEQSPNGQPDTLILSSQTNALLSEIKHFKTITEAELGECFRLGIRGESGPYFGLCPKTYHQFLKWWCDKKDRGLAWTEYLDKINGFVRAEKPSLGKEFYNSACENAYTKYLEKGEIPHAPFSYYDCVKEYLGLETLIEKGQYNDVKNEAKKLYDNKLKKCESTLKELLKGAELNEKENKVFANCIKEIAIKRYFERLKDNGVKTLK